MSNDNPQTVSCDVRYSTAGNETVARIQARDHVLEIFITLSGALIAFGLTRDHGLFAAVIGYAALAAALLSRHHDVIVGLLGEFQSDLAKHGAPGGMPNWFDPKDIYFNRVLNERAVRDLALIFFITFGGVFGLVVSKPTLSHFDIFHWTDMQMVFWEGSAVSLLLAFLTVIWTFVTRMNLAREIAGRTNTLQGIWYLIVIVLCAIGIMLSAFGVFCLYMHVY